MDSNDGEGGFTLRNIWDPDHRQYDKYLTLKKGTKVKLQSAPDTSFKAYTDTLLNETNVYYLHMTEGCYKGWLWKGPKGKKVQAALEIGTPWKFTVVKPVPIIKKMQ